MIRDKVITRLRLSLAHSAAHSEPRYPPAVYSWDECTRDGAANKPTDLVLLSDGSWCFRSQEGRCRAQCTRPPSYGAGTGESLSRRAARAQPPGAVAGARSLIGPHISLCVFLSLRSSAGVRARAKHNLFDDSCRPRLTCIFRCAFF